jgi:hypothetical protein
LGIETVSVRVFAAEKYRVHDLVGDGLQGCSGSPALNSAQVLQNQLTHYNISASRIIDKLFVFSSFKDIDSARIRFA